MESRTSYRGVCGERQTGKKRQGKASDWRIFETCAEDRSDPARRRQEIDKGTSFMGAEDGLLVYVISESSSGYYETITSQLTYTTEVN